MRLLTALACAALLSACSPSTGTLPLGAVPVCTDAQLLGYVPDTESIEAHRLAPERAMVSYAHSIRRAEWGFDATLRVDTDGRVVCHSGKDQFDRPITIGESRLDLLRALRYRPFLRDGKPVDAVIRQPVREQEIPADDAPLPDVPLDEVHIRLERTGCFGWCPAYAVEIFGDGRVVYEGDRYVNVTGRHEYRIPVAEVKKLVDSMRAKRLWSTRFSYRGQVTDNPTYILTVDMGGQVHRIEDYVGAMVGMPLGVSEFEDEVDAAARAKEWIDLSRRTVDQLKVNGFDFRSQEATDLLLRAAQGDSRDDAALVEMVALGTPIEGGVAEVGRWRGVQEPLIEAALSNQFGGLADVLIARGALQTNGRLDGAKLDAAFRAAIRGGRLAAVERVWNAGGDTKPSLRFNDVVDDDATDNVAATTKAVPVTLLLSAPWKAKQPWQGQAIAQWLAAKGCDLKAHRGSGGTLLHTAAKAGDLAFVQYLLAQGLDASTPGEYELPALGSVSDEDVAMALLQAGTDMSQMGDFAGYARENHWGRVTEWLQAHKR